MTLVVDASMVVAGLTDSGADGRWAEALLAGDSLAAPYLMPVEAANILRRAAQAGDISADVASLAHTDLLDLRVEFFPYQPCAGRVWELRENVTCYDGWYVAVAELLDAPLATLDGRLANSPGPRCRFLLPPALGLAAWFAYAPTVRRDTGHAVDAAHLPWWAFAIGIVLAIATSALASRRPAKTMAAVPVVTALSGRPAPPKAVHRSALPGVIVLAAGLACLASAGGLNGLAGGNGPNGGADAGRTRFACPG